MATDLEKAQSSRKLLELVLGTFAEGVYDIMGDSVVSLGTMQGAVLLKWVEDEFGLDTSEGSDVQAMLQNLANIFVDELGAAEEVKLTGNEEEQELHVKGCRLLPLARKMAKNGIQPFLCPYLNITVAALAQRFGAKMIVEKRHADPSARVCTHKISRF